jgi:hypothetical protein
MVLPFLCPYDRNRRSHPAGVAAQRVTEISPWFGSRDYLVTVASSRLLRDQAAGISRCPGCGVGGAGIAAPATWPNQCPSVALVIAARRCRCVASCFATVMRSKVAVAVAAIQ